MGRDGFEFGRGREMLWKLVAAEIFTRRGEVGPLARVRRRPFTRRPLSATPPRPSAPVKKPGS